MKSKADVNVQNLGLLSIVSVFMVINDNYSLLVGTFFKMKYFVRLQKLKHTTHSSRLTNDEANEMASNEQTQKRVGDFDYVLHAIQAHTREEKKQTNIPNSVQKPKKKV